MKHLVIGLFFALFSLSASAGYKAAGCGLGALVFKNNNEWWAQTFAATTNGTGVQTFGITTGTSECDANALFGQMEKAKVFIEANKNEISNDVARGQGETINALAGIYNCQATESFAAALQSQYAEIFSENESSDKLALKMQAVALNSCQANI